MPNLLENVRTSTVFKYKDKYSDPSLTKLTTFAISAPAVLNGVETVKKKSFTLCKLFNNYGK